MVIRVNKTKDYTVMSNYHLKDNSISLKAKGLLSQMLSLPEEWDYTVEGLCSINKESRTAIESALDELKQVGYLVVTKLLPNQTKSGRIEYQYDIYETPEQGVEKQGVENLGVEFLGVEIQGVENHQQLNTNKSNTKDKVLKDNILSPKRFVKPTVQDIKAYCIERGNNIDAETFYDYYESVGWKVGKKPMKDWKATVRYWETRNKKQSKQIDFDEMAKELMSEMRL